jgi:hypothetical protein
MTFVGLKKGDIRKELYGDVPWKDYVALRSGLRWFDLTYTWIGEASFA